VGGGHIARGALLIFPGDGLKKESGKKEGVRTREKRGVSGSKKAT